MFGFTILYTHHHGYTTVPITKTKQKTQLNVISENDLNYLSLPSRGILFLKFQFSGGTGEGENALSTVAVTAKRPRDDPGPVKPYNNIHQDSVAVKTPKTLCCWKLPTRVANRPA